MANRLTFPVRVSTHPQEIVRDREADQAIRSIVFEPTQELVPMQRSLISRLWRRRGSGSVVATKGWRMLLSRKWLRRIAGSQGPHFFQEQILVGQHLS